MAESFNGVAVPADFSIVGCDDVLSIEHEDVTMTPLEGVRRSVDLLKRVMLG